MRIFYVTVPASGAKTFPSSPFTMPATRTAGAGFPGEWHAGPGLKRSIDAMMQDRFRFIFDA